MTLIQIEGKEKIHQWDKAAGSREILDIDEEKRTKVVLFPYIIKLRPT